MSISEKIGKYVLIFFKYFSLVFFSFVALLPVVSCVITAFKTDEEYQNTNVMVLPKSWLNFENFANAFEKAGYLHRTQKKDHKYHYHTGS